MDYTPHTDDEIAQMLEAVGAADIKELFGPIPANLWLDRPMDLPPPIAESELMEQMARLAAKNVAVDQLTCFAGGGAYDHYVPAVVGALAGRAEFATSYTPYQPELSQGVLGALFDYQSLICELTGMEVSNAGLYDGANAITEAVAMAVAAGPRGSEPSSDLPVALVTRALNPNYRRVLETMAHGLGCRLEEAPALMGLTDFSSFQEAACLVVAQPNYYGCIEDIRAAAREAERLGAMLVVHYDLLSAGILEAPGALGADIVTGDGMSLGNGLHFGGPGLGIFATKRQHMRRMPGRICGRTTDARGKPGYVLTLQTREQHIRRERATSNICTDQTLMAVSAAVYLSWLGPRGLEETGRNCAAGAGYAAEVLSSVPGCSLAFEAPFFKEFVLRVPGSAEKAAAGLAERGYLAGPVVDLEEASPGAQYLLVAVTERRSAEQIDELAKVLSEVIA